MDNLSTVFIVLLLLAVVLLAWGAILKRFLSFRRIPLYVYCGALTGWSLAFIIAALIPFDTASTTYLECLGENPFIDEDSSSNSENLTENNCNDPTIQLSPSFLVVIWNIIYWSTFILCWTVFPIGQSFATAGDFTFGRKLLQALKENAIFYGICGVIVVVFFILALAFGIIGKNVSDWVGVAMSCSNAWGLFFLLCLMGYGIVNAPRRLWQSSEIDKELEHMYFKIAELDEELDRIEPEVFENFKNVRSYERCIKPGDPFFHELKIIISDCPPDFSNVTECGEEPKLELSQLVLLHYKVVDSSLRRTQAQTLFEQTLSKAMKYEDIMKCQRAGTFVDWKQTFERNKIVNFFSYVYFMYLRRIILKTLSIFFVLFGIGLIWSECTFWISGVRLSIFSVVMNPVTSTGSELLFIVVNSIPIGYMCWCVFNTLTHIKLFSYYRLLPHKQTDSNSILFCSSYLCRLGPPLALNYLHIINAKGTGFQHVMSYMENVPFFGNSFNDYAPSFIVVVCIIALFDIARRFAQMFGLSGLVVFDKDDKNELITQGSSITRRARNGTLKLSSMSDALISDSSPEQNFTRVSRDLSRPSNICGPGSAALFLANSPPVSTSSRPRSTSPPPSTSPRFHQLETEEGNSEEAKRLRSIYQKYKKPLERQ